MLTSDLDFDLPDELIARYPANPRDSARLMVVERCTGAIRHCTFADLPELLDPRDVLVRNNTRVLAARLLGQRMRTGGKWEGLFLGESANGLWEILATTRGHPRPGERILVGQGLELELIERRSDGGWLVRPHPDLNQPWETLALLERHGQTPLPPYIRGGRAEPGDTGDYQTIYAMRPGAVAAPTAGLHFTARLFEKLAARGLTWVDVTVHIGVGTFRPIQAARIEDHSMHSEWAELTPEAATRILERQTGGGRIVAVGTTSTRALETAAQSGRLEAFQGETSLYIKPGHTFHAVDALITNFHLPRSSLLVLVSALAGTELIREAYRQAVDCRYRFYSYGDAMLIL